MKTTSENRIIYGFVTALILLLISFVIGIYVYRQMKHETELVIHSNNVLNHIEVLISDVKDGETGMRGYFAAKDSIFLEPFYNSQQNYPNSLAKLKVLISDNKSQLQILDSMQYYIQQKYKALNFVPLSVTTYGFVMTDTLKKLSYISKNYMDKVRSIAEQMKYEEVKILNQRNAQMQSFRYGLNFINISSLIIALLLSAYTILAYLKENKQKHNYKLDLVKKIDDLRIVNNELITLKQNEKFAATGRIARTIAHEVRNPLTNITLAAEQLKDTIDSKDDTDLYFDMIARNSNRINQLVSELLNATKNIDLKKTKVSVNTILDAAMLLAEDRIALHHLKVEKNYSTDICDVLVDVEQIKIALLNIIVNAIEAMPTNQGVLALTTRGYKGKCQIIISDNGEGIQPDNVVKLFEPYYTNKTKGNGLGLTNTQNIILNHKGNISVQSEVNNGTTFTITLDFAE